MQVSGLWNVCQALDPAFFCSDSAKTSTRSQKALWLQLRETLIAYWLARFSASLLSSYSCSWPEGCAACSRWHCCRLHVHAAENRFCGLSEITRRLQVAPRTGSAVSVAMVVHMAWSISRGCGVLIRRAIHLLNTKDTLDQLRWLAKSSWQLNFFLGACPLTLDSCTFGRLFALPARSSSPSACHDSEDCATTCWKQSFFFLARGVCYFGGQSCNGQTRGDGGGAAKRRWLAQILDHPSLGCNAFLHSPPYHRRTIYRYAGDVAVVPRIVAGKLDQASRTAGASGEQPQATPRHFATMLWTARLGAAQFRCLPSIRQLALLDLTATVSILVLQAWHATYATLFTRSFLSFTWTKEEEKKLFRSQKQNSP